MNKILKIVCTLLIIVAVFFVLHFIITIDSVDKWITGLFKEEVLPCIGGSRASCSIRFCLHKMYSRETPPACC